MLGQSLATSMPGSDAPIQVEGWSTEIRGTSDAVSNSYSNASSDFSSVSQSDSESESETEGETVVPVWVPIPIQELGSEAEANRETKLSRVAQLLKEQMQQHCFIKLDTDKTQPLLVPFVRDFGLPEQSLLEYQQEVYQKQHALPAADVDLLLEESRQKFLAAACHTDDLDLPDTPLEPAVEALPKPKTSKKKQPAPGLWNRIPKNKT